RSIVVLAKKFGIRAREIHELPNAQFIKFTAQTRMSGLDLEGVHYRKGAADAICKFLDIQPSAEISQTVEKISRAGGTPLLVATRTKILGVIHLKDIVKGGLPERFKRLRAM